MANKYLFANLLLSESGEGDEATSPSSTTSYEPIQASRPSLETLISACAFSGGGKASTLPTANKCLFADLLLFESGEGDEATSPSFTTSYASIQASSPLLEALISAWCVQ